MSQSERLKKAQSSQGAERHAKSRFSGKADGVQALSPRSPLGTSWRTNSKAPAAAARCISASSATRHIPYQLCYCSICRKTAGGGGFAINLMGDMKSLKLRGKKVIRIFHAKIEDDDGVCEKSRGQRHFCSRCATALWLYDPRWPELVHPFASAIDSPLPQPPSKVHLMLKFKPFWVVPDFGRGDARFQKYPKLSIEDWHRKRGLWSD
jgi:hypothetical protein